MLSSKLLTDPDKDSVLDGLEWIKREVAAQDVAMIFLAGHGVNDLIF
jgi:copper homeostasis protein CutC